MTNPLAVIARHLSTKTYALALRYTKQSHDAEEILLGDRALCISRPATKGQVA